MIAQSVRPLAIVLLLFSLSGCGVNAIPTLEEQVKADWSQVLNQYKRRTDLIPNLVAVVEGAADFEKETLLAVVEARSQVGKMEIPSDILTNPNAFKAFEQNQSALSSALSRLLVVVERYPTLTATQGYIALQSQLEGTENRIAVARRDYIDAVRVYNTELRTFPGRIWAAILYGDAVAMENFSIEEAETAVPKVTFGD
jgi:LemA protein